MFSIAEISKTVKGKIEGDPELRIKGVCDIQDSRSGYISYILPGKNENYFADTKATALLTSNSFKLDRQDKTLIRVKNPALSFIDIIHMFFPKKQNYEAIHPSAVVAENVQLGTNVEIAPHVVIENGVEIGNSVRIGAGSFIGYNTEIGNGSSISSNVSIYHEITIGNNCIIDSGTVIGADGYGLISDENIHYKIPHIGSVYIGNDVWIGSNCSIDRGTLSNTVVGSGSKIGSKYDFLTASTNEAYCPTLKGQVKTALTAEIGSVLEIVIDGIDEKSISEAMRIGIEAACSFGPSKGIYRISAGNYGGNLGKHLFHLRKLFK